MRELEDTLLFSEAWLQTSVHDSNPLFSLALAQLPATEGRYWIGLSDEEKGDESPQRDWVRSPLSLIVASHGRIPEFQESTRVVTGGLLLDEVQETVPVENVDTSVAFQYDAPGSQPPQTLLLAVPPQMKETPDPWTPEMLAAIVRDTIDLAKVRTVDLDALSADIFTSEDIAPEPLGSIMPGIYFQLEDSPLSDEIRDSVQGSIKSWFDALKPRSNSGR